MGDQPDQAPGGSGTTGQTQRHDDRRPGGGSASTGIKIGSIFGIPIFLSMFALVFAVLIASLMVNLNEQRLPGAAQGHLILLAAIT
nr:hypothetical protein [Micromonospora sp. DSM 115978]